jgi:formate-dependent nitrite reductase membrane component NrfD
MTEELLWGMPVILYLFLAGVGAGACTVSASVFLRGGGSPEGTHFEIAKYGAFLAPLPVMIGCGLLIFELGSFAVGDWFKWINLYLVINLSPMSIGTWLLTLFIMTSVGYAYTFVPQLPIFVGERQTWRRWLAWVNVPLGIAVAVYTGVLLGAMPSRPFWNSPILALLFLMSALSTGVAAILLARALFSWSAGDADKERQFHSSGYLLSASDVLLIGIELMVIFLFIMFAYLTVGDVRHAIAVILPGGELAMHFWLGVIVICLVLPALIELFYVAPRLLFHKDYAAPRGIEILVPAAVLVGGFALRYVVVIAGQITGPVGV